MPEDNASGTQSQQGPGPRAQSGASQPKLVLLLTHGIGEPQPGGTDAYADDQRWFVAQLEARVAQLAGPGLLAIRWADWSDLYVEDCARWLKLMFAYSLSPAQQRRRALQVLGWVVLLGLACSLGPVLGTLLIPERSQFAVWLAARLPGLGLAETNVLLGWLLGTVLLFILAAAVGRLVFKRLPWGQVWYFARKFEAGGLSDIVMYLSPGPRRAMQQRLLAALEPELERVQAAGANSLPVVLAGHSLGSVLVYDLLCASSAAGRGGRRQERAGTPLGQLEAELGELKLRQRALYKQQAKAGLPAEPAAELAGLEQRGQQLKRLIELIYALKPVGLCTFGAPISFFMFRDPPGIDPARAFACCCPPMFKQTGKQGKVRWRWLNFWHSSDPVAHRLAPLVQAVGWPPGRMFVEDVRLRYPAPQPVAAHLLYWRQAALVEQFAAQLAEWISQLP
jgi:hypothetical protein